MADRTLVLAFRDVGFPDWVAHRLWIGTVLFLAGLGVCWMTRVLGFTPLAALTAALVYQLSPFILPYISRTSVLLLPYAGLGWIVGLTVMASLRGRWRYPAAIALVVLTVGAVNATALAMVVPAPVLWLIHAAWDGTITWRRAASNRCQDQRSLSRRVALVDRDVDHPRPIRGRCVGLLGVTQGGVVHLDINRGHPRPRLLAVLCTRCVRRHDNGID